MDCNRPGREAVGHRVCVWSSVYSERAEGTILTHRVLAGTDNRHVALPGDDGYWSVRRPGCFQCGRLVKLYADPGTTVMLRTDRDSPTGRGQSRMTLSGHLVSVP